MAAGDATAAGEAVATTDHLTTNALEMDIASIEDEGVRRRIAAAFSRLRERSEYGLVFEKHKPESVVLHGQQVREDRYVTLRAKPGPKNAFRVVEIDNGKAVLQPVDGHFRPTGVRTTEVLDALAPLARFGDPIFPGLEQTGEVLGAVDEEGNPTKPFHTVINGENFHALETLLYAYEGKVDCIYIDPPYNSGAKDWKYNNDYVDREDVYRHSLWLSFMEKRLKLAQRLLDPQDSVLIVTIDEKEYLRLGLLLEQVFKGARIQMVSTHINPAAVARAGAFGRVDEYIFFVKIGTAAPNRVTLSRDWVSAKGRTHRGVPRWDLLRRSGESAARSDSPGCFYPIYVDPDGPKVAQVGDAMPTGTSTPEPIDGLVPVLPIRKDGSEGRWQWQPRVFRERLLQGRVRITGNEEKGFVVSILKDGEYKKVLNNEFDLTGYGVDGSIQTATGDTETVLAVPGTQWRIPSHDATQYGSRMLTDSFLPGRKFPYPKSLYAVEDTLRFFVKDKPNALIVDFFAGSGTTAHAVMRLNRQYGGRRRALLVTNNEVAASEQQRLRNEGLNPGDEGWEALGICEYVTKPRIRAAITGQTPEGSPVTGEYRVKDYLLPDPFPMADGFEENARFFNLTYLDPESVEAKQSFGQIAHLLWLIAGAEGSVIDSEPRSGWALPARATYGVLFRNKGRAGFAEAMNARIDAGDPPRHVFIVADSTDEFHRSLEEVGADPARTTRLYRSYLKNFRTNVIDLKDEL